MSFCASSARNAVAESGPSAVDPATPLRFAQDDGGVFTQSAGSFLSYCRGFANCRTVLLRRPFAGALGFKWFASSLLTHAGPFGMLYGMAFRRTDQIFGEMFDLQGYRERDFWDKAWYIFNPANMALDYGLAVALQGLGNCIKFGTPTPPKTQVDMAYPLKGAL